MMLTTVRSCERSARYINSDTLGSKNGSVMSTKAGQKNP